MGLQETEGSYTLGELITIIVKRERLYKLNKYRTIKYYLDYKEYKDSKDRTEYGIYLDIVVDSTNKEGHMLKVISKEDFESKIEVGKEWGVLEGLIKESEEYLRRTCSGIRSIDALREKYDKFETKKRI